MASHTKLFFGSACMLAAEAQSVILFVALPSAQRCHGIDSCGPLCPGDRDVDEKTCGPLFSRGSRDPDEFESDNVIVQIIDRVADAFTTPAVPLFPDLAFGFPLVLMIQFLFVPLSQAILTVFLFGILRTAGSKIVRFEETSSEDLYGITDPNEDQISAMLPIDATALFLSFFSAILLDTSVNSATLFLFGLVFLVALVFAQGVREVEMTEQLTKDDKLLNRWDERFFKKDRKTDEN
jgi:hypothetical protein